MFGSTVVMWLYQGNNRHTASFVCRRLFWSLSRYKRDYFSFASNKRSDSLRQLKINMLEIKEK